MAIETGVLVALSFVLTAAGGSKLLSGSTDSATSGTLSRLSRPVVALGELLLAGVVLAGPSVPAGFVLASVFGAFALVHVRLWRSTRGGDCGCFGDSGARSGIRQISLAAVSAIAAAAASLGNPPSLLHLALGRPLAALLVATAAGVTAWLWQRTFAAASVSHNLSLSERLIVSSASFLERRVSRRTLLVRVATAGSALAVAPLRYLLYPGTALAAITPATCTSGACTDGWTAFCCEINQGSNTCPAGTFPGGWWMCTDYTGRELCQQQGVRYYVDCNQIPGDDRAGPCRCAHDDCSYRRVACNVFRYGQCNTQISGKTPVVCRMVVCENPGTIPALNCSSSLAIEDAVCAQDVPCLQPAARQWPGDGGV